MHDVLIIGAGAAAAAAAFELAQRGIRPLMLDAGAVDDNPTPRVEGNLYDFRRHHDSFDLHIGADYRGLAHLVSAEPAIAKLQAPHMAYVTRDAEVLGRALRAVSGNLTDLDLYVARDAEAVDVMLVETDRAEARVEAERLAAALADVHPARIGVATFPGDSPSPALLGAAADLAARGAAGPGVHSATDAVRVLRFGEREVIVADRAMNRVFGLIERVAPTELSVLFTGETGTGKEGAATALHALFDLDPSAVAALGAAPETPPTGRPEEGQR